MRNYVVVVLLSVASLAANAQSALSVAAEGCQQPKTGTLLCDFPDPLPVPRLQTIAAQASVVHLAANSSATLAVLKSALPYQPIGKTAVKPVPLVYRIVADLTPAGQAALAAAGGIGTVTYTAPRAMGTLRARLPALIDAQCADIESDRQRWTICKIAVQLRLCEVENVWGRDDMCPAGIKTSKSVGAIASRTCSAPPASAAWEACRDKISDQVAPATTEPQSRAPVSAGNAGETLDTRIARLQSECRGDGFLGAVAAGACKEKVRVTECFGHWSENPPAGASSCKQERSPIAGS
jgi:hypothetical protein